MNSTIFIYESNSDVLTDSSPRLYTLTLNIKVLHSAFAYQIVPPHYSSVVMPRTPLMYQSINVWKVIPDQDGWIATLIKSTTNKEHLGCQYLIADSLICQMFGNRIKPTFANREALSDGKSLLRAIDYAVNFDLYSIER